MTREEAINEIKSWDFLEGKEIEAIHTLIPELAESEDERIRKRLINLIRELANTKLPILTCGYFVDGQDKDYIAYLEKQKEGEKEVSDLFDSTDSYNKGFRAGQEKSLQELKEHIKEDKTQCYAYDAGYAAGFIVGKEQGWKEHKAFVKENSKTADSIPSDCVSDAKCEDRWHKVGDSLPDNPREVLCKDEAGNYFIGRYYVGEGWEISNYDDEDKPHHLNPPVSKWIDFPSEKQKESLHISETCKENADSFTDACKDVIVAIEKYLDWLTGYPDYAPKGKYSLRDMLYCLSILEKQKEEEGYEAIPVESTLEYKLGFKAGKESEKQKKPENVSASTMIPSCWAEEPSLQEEQKPTEPSDEELVRHPPIAYTYPSDASRDEQLKMALLALLNSDLIKVAGNKFTKQDLIDWVEKQQEQKPAEWSKEDEDMLVSVLHFLNTNRINERGKVITWVKSLPERFNLQPKQEWSEEDEKMRDRLIDRLQFITLNTRTDGTSPNITFFDEIDWLKSLTLRCPKSSDNWRPSEELIGCLERVIAFKHPEPEDIDGCNSLIEQLKKLI